MGESKDLCTDVGTVLHGMAAIGAVKNAGQWVNIKESFDHTVIDDLTGLAPKQEHRGRDLGEAGGEVYPRQSCLVRKVKVARLPYGMKQGGIYPELLRKILSIEINRIGLHGICHAGHQ